MRTRITSADGEEDLADVDAGDEAVGLAEGAAHAGLETIGACARQHFVDADDMIGVRADAEVEAFLSGDLDKVPVSRRQSVSYPLDRGDVCSLVGADTGSFECLRAQLLILVGDEVDAARELIDIGTLAAQVEDADLRVWHTAVESRLGVRLVLAVAVAPSWTASHDFGVVICCGCECREKKKRE